MYQSLRTVLNVKDTYSSVSDRIGDYKTMLEASMRNPETWEHRAVRRTDTDYQ